MTSSIPASEPVPFGELTPDLMDFGSPGATVVYGCIPYGDLYKPFPALAALTNALPSKFKGGVGYRDAAGVVTIFAATATKIYQLSGLAWVDVTRAVGGNYATATDGFWDFVNFGTLVIATNYVDDIQVFDVGTSTNFSQLSATAPKCRRMAVVKNFLMCIDTVDGDGPVGYRVRWSPLGDPQGDWTPAPTTTQSDFEDIPGGDFANTFITAIQDYGFIVQGRELWRFDYVGGADIFTFTPLDKGRGSLLPRPSVSNGRSVFFIGEDGFYEYDGTNLINIGNEKINKYFYSIFNQSFDFNTTVGIDPINTIIYWSFPSTASADGTPDMLLAFNWINRRFTIIPESMEGLFQYISTGVTMDGIDSSYPSVDAMPYSLDSRFWTGGKTGLAAFGTDHKLGLFTGSAKTATIATEEIRPNNSGRALLASIIPYVDGGATITVAVGYRAVMGDAIVYTDYMAQNQYTGEFDFDVDAVFFRASFQISGSWTFARGLAYRAAPSGQA